MTKVPAGWSRYDDWQEAEQHHFSDSKNMEREYPDHPYWFFVKRWNQVNQNYIYHENEIIGRNRSLQIRINAKAQELDSTLPAKLTKKNRAKTEEELNAFTADFYKEIILKR